MGIYLHLCQRAVGRFQAMDLCSGDHAGGTLDTEWSDMNEWIMNLIGIALIAVVIVIWA